MKTAIYITNSTDPWKNLAVEEYLLNTQNLPTLYLWQNNRTVVIGRHQNAWAECDVKSLEASGGRLARRLSGGGAVYHDLGNLNFTFILPNDLFDRARQNSVILNAVRAVGINAEANGRNDLLADGRKFSGHAFCTRGGNSYHHGTLMVNSNLDRLTAFLTVDASKLASKAISSVRSRVVNLRELCYDLSVFDLVQEMMEAFTAEYGEAENHNVDTELDIDEVRDLEAKYASWDWRFGETPRFDARYKTRFPWGGVEVQLSLRDAHVERAKVFTDSLDTEFAGELERKLVGVAFDAGEVEKAVGGEVGAWLARELA